MPDLFCRIYFERTQLLSLGRGSMARLCKLSQSQPSCKWAPEEICGR